MSIFIQCPQKLFKCFGPFCGLHVSSEPWHLWACAQACQIALHRSFLRVYYICPQHYYIRRYRVFFPEYTLERFLCDGILVQYFRKNNTHSYSSWLKLSMEVTVHIVNMNQVKETKKNNLLLTGTIINTLSSQQVNYIIFIVQDEHLAHKMAIFTHPSTVSISDIHKKCLSHHLKPF